MAKNLASQLILIFMTCAICISAALTAQADDQAPIRLDLRLMASDLVDDVIYSWLQNPPVSGPADFIVAEIDAPIGIDKRFETDIENHLFELVRANPRLPISLVHCAVCRQWMAVSGPKRTIIGRALEQPEGQEQLSHYPHLHALSLHFDVVGTDLVLWAELYEVASPQRVVWSQRYAHATTARVLLRDPNHLISIPEAREEQKRILAGRETIQAVTRFPIRTFKGAGSTGGATQVAPLLFLDQSLEAILSPHRNKRAGLSLGVTSIKGSMQGWSFGTSYQQLLFRDEPSLTEPDLYLRAAVTFMRLEGPGAAVFSGNQIDVAHLINSNDDVRASLTTYQIGLEAHIKYRFGVSVFLEYIPQLEESQVIATQHLLIPFHSIGVSGVFLW